MTSLYLPEEQVLIELEDIEKAPRMKDTLQVHMIKKLFDVYKVWYLLFFLI